MANEQQRPVTIVVHQPGACQLIKAGEGFALRGKDLTNPRGGKLCAQAICSAYPRLMAILRDLAPGAPLSSEFITCGAVGCNATFRLEEPTPNDQSGIFTTPFMRRKTDRTILPEGDQKKRPVPFLKRLSLELSDELHFIGFEKKFGDGQMILQQGLIVDQLQILTHGMATIVVRREGDETLIGSISEGDFFGEHSLLTRLPSDFEVRSVGDCSVLVINQKDFYQLLLKRPTLFQIVSKIISEKFKAAAETVENELSRGILGKLSMIPLFDLIQTLHQSRRTGTLVIHFRTEQAFIVFYNGSIVSAVSGKKRGEDAVYRVLAWQEGEFCFEPSESFQVAADRVGAVQMDTMGLMMEGMRRIDEHRAAAAKSPPPKK